MNKKLVINLLLLLLFLLSYLFSIQKLIESYKPSIDKIILSWEARVYMINALVLFVLLAAYFKKFVKVVKIPRRVLAYASLVFFVALVIRVYLPPKTSRLMFDGDIYLDMAKQILQQQRSCLCDYGNKTQCFQCELMKWPVGHPFLFSIGFLLFGINQQIAFHVTAIVSSLAVFFLFLATYLLFNDEKIAIFSSLSLALSPVPILWSGTLSADTSFSLATSMALFLVAVCRKTNDFKVHAISLTWLALLSQMKAEAVILVPLFFLSIISKKYLKLLTKKKYILLIFVLFAFLFLFNLHIIYENQVNTWGAKGGKFSLAYFESNVKDNLIYWMGLSNPTLKRIKQLYHPIGFTILSILGFVYGLRRYKRISLILTLWFTAFFVLYASFYAGSVYYGVDVRYTLPGYVIFSSFVGLGFYFLYSLKKKNWILVLLLILLFSYFGLYVEKIHTPANRIEEGSDARLYREFAINFASKQPDDCYFISHVTSLYSWLGKGHIQIWYQERPEFNKMIKDKRCVIFDKGYWCNLPTYNRLCDVSRYKTILLRSFHDAAHSKTYSFYKIIG